MGKVINITIRGKIAVYTDDVVYVCGNSDYIIHFDFDAEWNEHEYKTARFITDDGSYTDVVFQGNECAVPVLSNTYKIKVGVFAGNLSTTTPATISAKKSILCGSGTPADPMPDVYGQIAQMIEDGMLQGPQGEPGPQGPQGEPGKDADPYTLPTASATVKGGVKVGNGLRMDGDVLGVVPEGEYELIETITLEEDAQIVRTEEPDGKPYNFSAMYVEFRSNKNVPGYNVYFYTDGVTNAPIWINAITNNANNEIWYAYAEIMKIKGLWHATTRTPTRNNYITNLQESVYANNHKAVTCFTSAINTPIAAGTIILIWGVRADA